MIKLERKSLTLTDIFNTLGTFHKSINKPMKTLILTTVLVSLSNTYNNTISEVTHPNSTEFTDNPSKDFLLRQNWMSN
jgi:hypothetical protein